MIRSYIRPAIEEALTGIRATFEVMSPESALVLRSSLSLQFCGSDSPRSLHWNNLLDYQAVQHPEAWRWVDEFVRSRPVFLFAHIDHEPSVFSLANGVSVSKVLSECPGFEFYLADKGLSFLLCENTHDFLFGAGAAKEWVVQLMPRHEEWVASLAGRESRD